MNEIFKALDSTILYNRCISASIAHAIMIGEYDMLTSEQSWDGNNFNFQNMENIRGVISFEKEGYVCTVQNYDNYIVGEENILSEIFNGSEMSIKNLAKNEALQYMMIENKGKDISAISVAFWGNEKSNFSNQSESELLQISEEIILPFILNEKEAKDYWIEYYEMNDEQVIMMEEIYDKKIKSNSRLVLSKIEKNKLKKWFDNIDECVESFKEMNIIFK